MTLGVLKRSLFVLTGLLSVLLATQTVVSAPPIPNPVLFMVGSETLQSRGKRYIRYHYDVLNKSDYPAALFAAAPDLPPCGVNTKSSRSWVDIFDQRGKRLNGFCAISKPADLNVIWFELEEDVVPPSYIYIEISDRQTNTKYKSNLADTTL